MEFKCNFDEMDYTRMIGQGLKIEAIKIILGIGEIADIEKVLILKKMLGIEDEHSKNQDYESGE